MHAVSATGCARNAHWVTGKTTQPRPARVCSVPTDPPPPEYPPNLPHARGWRSSSDIEPGEWSEKAAAFAIACGAVSAFFGAAARSTR